MVTEFNKCVDQYAHVQHAEVQHMGDRRRKAVEGFFVAHNARLAQSGSIVPSWRGRGDGRSGPYYRLTCRDTSGRQQSVYLGREGPLVEHVRQALAGLQEPGRWRRQQQHLERALRAEITAARRAMDPQLNELGLNRRGTEIRGWQWLAQ